MAAALPPKYMGIVSFGSGISGLACNILRALTLFVFKPDTEKGNEKQMAYYSAILFFNLAALTLLFCLFLHYFRVKKNPFFIYYLDWDVASSTNELKENLLDLDSEMKEYNIHLSE